MHLKPIATILAACFLFGSSADAQLLYPIKKDKKWGLINREGQLVLPARYDAIGDFDSCGLALVQLLGKSGLIDSTGSVLVAPQYEVLTVLGPSRFAVMEDGHWKLRDNQGRDLLPLSYDEIVGLGENHFLFRKDDKWGIANDTGRVLSMPAYDAVSIKAEFGQVYFVTENNGLTGLVLENGTLILPPVAEEVTFVHPYLFIYRNGLEWRAVDHRGLSLPVGAFHYYQQVEPLLFYFQRRDTATLIDLTSHKVLSRGVYRGFSPFDSSHVLCRIDSKVGLMHKDGHLVLSTCYSEIYPHLPALYRANIDGRWGLVAKGDSTVLSFEHSYIGAMMRNGHLMLMRDSKYGLSDAYGKVLIEPVYDRLEFASGKVIARREGTLLFLDLDEDENSGPSPRYRRHFTISVNKQENRTRNYAYAWSNAIRSYNSEWYFDAGTESWGMRRLSDGSIKIPPVFERIDVLEDLGLTLVAVYKPNEFYFGGVRFKTDRVYGLVKNDTGKLVHKLNLIDLEVDSLKKGKSTARCIYDNGSHGLVSKSGQDLQLNFSYLGPFKDGVALASKSGSLTAVTSSQLNSHHSLGSLSDYFSEMLEYPTLQLSSPNGFDLLRTGKVICSDCKWGYIDTTGKWVVQPIYQAARDFENKTGIVRKGQHWGVVDAQGNELLPCQYDDISMMNSAGGIALKIFRQQEKYGLVDSTGAMILEAVYDQVGAIRNGHIAVERNKTWGFADEQGREVIPCQYQRVGSFNEGLAAVQLGNKWGFIDTAGNAVLACFYSKVGNFSNGLAPAKDHRLQLGYIDRSGQWVIKPQFTKAQDFDRGVARVEMKAGSYLRTALIDTLGRLISKPKFQGISDFDQHGLAVAKLDGKSTRRQLINLKGQLMGSDNWQTIHPFREGLARVQDGGLTGYIDTSGQLVIPLTFSKAGDFHEGLAVAWRDKRCGYIDRSGAFAIAPEFNRCGDFQDSIALVGKTGRPTGLIDHQGREAIQTGELKILAHSEGRTLVEDNNRRQYFINENKSTLGGKYRTATAFSHGVAAVKKRGSQWALINRQGVLISAAKFDKVYGFEDGYAKVRVKGVEGLVNERGEYILDPAYDSISSAGKGMFRVERGNKIGYVDFSGNWVWDLQD
jgi:hypothetical protein